MGICPAFEVKSALSPSPFAMAPLGMVPPDLHLKVGPPGTNPLLEAAVPSMHGAHYPVSMVPRVGHAQVIPLRFFFKKIKTSDRLNGVKTAPKIKGLMTGHTLQDAAIVMSICQYASDSGPSPSTAKDAECF